MTDYLPLTLERSEIAQWHHAVCEQVDAMITTCSDALEELLREEKVESKRYLSVDGILKNVLTNSATYGLFGTPKRKRVLLPSGEDFYSRVEWERWGRRVYFHARALRRGLEHHNAFDRAEGASRQLKTIQILEDRFRTTFPGSLPSIHSFKAEMEKGGLNHRSLSQFTTSRIDPVLYTSLRYLNRSELTNSDHILKFLYGNLSYSVDQFMHGRRAPISDDALLWWAQYNLIRHFGREYSVGTHTDYSGARSVCRRLIQECSNELIIPPESVRLYEMRPDIYDCIRTRLVIMLNAINIARVMPADRANKNDDLPVLLSSFISEYLDWISSKTLKSMYQIGLALQVSSTAMMYFDEFIKDGGQSGKGRKKRKSGDRRLDEESKAVWSLGGRKFRIDFYDGTEMTITLPDNYARLLVALVKNGGSGSLYDLLKWTTIVDENGELIRNGVANPSTVFERGEDQYKAIGCHVFMPGGRGEGGYRTTIRDIALRESRGTNE